MGQGWQMSRGSIASVWLHWQANLFSKHFISSCGAARTCWQRDRMGWVRGLGFIIHLRCHVGRGLLAPEIQLSSARTLVPCTGGIQLSPMVFVNSWRLTFFLFPLTLPQRFHDPSSKWDLPHPCPVINSYNFCLPFILLLLLLLLLWLSAVLRITIANI